MNELFANIKEEVKLTAEQAWQIALAFNDPMSAANFLDCVIKSFEFLYTEEEIEFLRFYFKMQMEMMKK